MIKDPVEILYLCLMRRWQSTAPPDKHHGMLDGEPEINSQVARLAYVLKKIAVGQVDEFFRAFAKVTVKTDGSSYISKEHGRMEAPYPLWEGWFLEGCVSLEQKREIIRKLRLVGLSPTFAKAVDTFVSGESIDKYLPSKEEDEEIVRQIEARESASREIHDV